MELQIFLNPRRYVLEDDLAGLAGTAGKAQRVINPGMAFFRPGGFPNIPLSVIRRFHGCGHTMVRRNRPAIVSQPCVMPWAFSFKWNASRTWVNRSLKPLSKRFLMPRSMILMAQYTSRSCDAFSRMPAQMSRRLSYRGAISMPAGRSRLRLQDTRPGYNRMILQPIDKKNQDFDIIPPTLFID